MPLHMFCTQGVTEELGASMSALNKFISNLDTVLAGSLNWIAGPRKDENSEVWYSKFVTYWIVLEKIGCASASSACNKEKFGL